MSDNKIDRSDVRFGSIADIKLVLALVCFVPTADIAQQAAAVAAGQVTTYKILGFMVAMGTMLCRAPCCCSC